MLCAIYKSLRKPGCYLYISKRDDFSAIPDVLMQSFGKPQFLMPFNLKGSKPDSSVLGILKKALR